MKLLFIFASKVKKANQEGKVGNAKRIKKVNP